ncbi:diguanylate cyclase [Clostridia bacterium]|nr:diguanylate cyclase [Clostridia bacterium]
MKTGLALSALMILLSLLSLFYTPFDYNAMDFERFLPPGGEHLLGTDYLGRDTFSRVMIGGRYTILVALLTVAGSAAIGTALGLAAGYFGGLLGECVMRVMDAVSAFPGILLAIVTVSVFSYGKYSIVLALIILFIPTFTRIARSSALEFKQRDFILSARVMGASHARIIFAHILPNSCPSLLSAIIVGLSNAILSEAALSYLGFGIQPPIPSWGRMLAESQSFLFKSPWGALAPGLAIMLTVIGFHFIGEGIRKRYS